MDVRSCGALIIGLTVALAAHCQPKADAVLELVVPYAPGGHVDSIARVLAPRLEVELRRKVVIQNRAGDGGKIGLSQVAKSPKDDRVIAIAMVQALASASTSSGGTVPFSDLSPVGLAGVAPSILVVGSQLEVRSVKELVQLAKAKQAGIAYASTGAGSPGHLMAERLAYGAGLKLVHVPYRNTASALADVVAGRVQLMFVPVPEALRYAREGRIRLLGISSGKRSPLAPDVPTIAESGIPGFDMTTGIAVVAPAGVTDAFVKDFNTAVARAQASGEVQAKLRDLGVETASGGPKELVALVGREIEHQRQLLAFAVEPWTYGPGATSSPPAVPAKPMAKPLPSVPAKPTAEPSPPPPPTPIRIPATTATSPATSSPIERPPLEPASKGQLGPAYWNTWFVEDGKLRTSLVKDESYSFQVDLSRLSYGHGASASVDPDFQNWVETHFDKEELVVNIHVVVLGDAVSLRPGQSPTAELTVKVGRLRRDEGQESAASHSLLEYRVGRIGIDALSSRVAAGMVTFKVQAARKGCATIVLSVWNSAMTVPLDNLVHTIPVYEKGSELMPTCADAGGRSALRGRAATLFSAALDDGRSGSIDAALHVFEFPRPTNARGSVAVFAVREIFRNAPPGASGTRRGIYSWALQSSLSDYLADPGKMEVLIRAARERAVSTGEPGAYEDVAQELKKKIFSSADDKERKVAQEALGALQELVKASNEPPVVLARVYSANGSLVYLPLGMLAAQSNDPVLQKRMVVVQPLPRERLRTKTSCIDSWTFGFPTSFQRESDLVSLPAPTAKSRGTWVRTIQDLKAYLSREAVAPSAERGEGFLLLAHHNDGMLWFDSPTNRVIPEDVHRNFAPGSLAILSACSMAGAKEGNRVLLELLNERSIDAIVVSPFPVDAGYGIQLARDFVDVIQEQSAKPGPVTVARLLQLATARTAAYFKSQGSLLRYDDMALEFLIAGDHTLRLCGAAEPR